jgi:hypothetical protein
MSLELIVNGQPIKRQMSVLKIAFPNEERSPA